MRTPPIAYVRTKIFDSIANRNTQLVNQLDRDEITHQAYLAMQFPADAISVIQTAIAVAFADFTKLEAGEEPLANTYTSADQQTLLKENPEEYVEAFSTLAKKITRSENVS